MRLTRFNNIKMAEDAETDYYMVEKGNGIDEKSKTEVKTFNLPSDYDKPTVYIVGNPEHDE